MSKSNWANVLPLLIGSKIDKIPPGFKTSAEYSKDWNKSISITRDHLQRLVALGAFKREMFHVQTVSNRVLPVPYYKQIK